jgi:hypothetical protein
LDERTINYRLATSGIEVPADLDERWKMLIAGLLAQDPSQRWGGAQIRDWLAGKPLPAGSNSRQAKASAKGGTATGERESEMAYSFKGGNYRTASELGEALARHWDDGIKHFGRGLILRWLETDLKDAQKAVQVAEISENPRLTPEMKLALVPMVMNDKLPLSWKGELVDEAFCQRNGELLWSMCEAGMHVIIDSLGRSCEILAQIADRKSRFEIKISQNRNNYDLNLVKKIIGAPEQKIISHAIQRIGEFLDFLEKENSEYVETWMEKMPVVSTWLPSCPWEMGECLVILSEKSRMRDTQTLTIFKEKARHYCEFYAAQGDAQCQTILREIDSPRRRAANKTKHDPLPQQASETNQENFTDLHPNRFSVPPQPAPGVAMWETIPPNVTGVPPEPAPTPPRQPVSPPPRQPVSPPPRPPQASSPNPQEPYIPGIQHTIIKWVGYAMHAVFLFVLLRIVFSFPAWIESSQFNLFEYIFLFSVFLCPWGVLGYLAGLATTASRTRHIENWEVLLCFLMPPLTWGMTAGAIAFLFEIISRIFGIAFRPDLVMQTLIFGSPL